MNRIHNLFQSKVFRIDILFHKALIREGKKGFSWKDCDAII